jgi:hypothetical protein
MPRKRRRIVAMENWVRDRQGKPTFVPVMPVNSPPSRLRWNLYSSVNSEPVVLRLAPVTVTVSASMECTVIRAEGGGYVVTVPETPSDRAAAFATVIGGGVVGELIAHATHSGGANWIVCVVAGFLGGQRVWNRWVAEYLRERRQG